MTSTITREDRLQEAALNRAKRTGILPLDQKEALKAAKMTAAELREAEIQRNRAMDRARLAFTTKSSPLAIRYTECRTLGHNWIEVEAKTNPALGWYLVVRCERCTSERRHVIDRFGVVLRTQYTYPEWYKDTDHWKRTDWRLQYLRRHVLREALQDETEILLIIDQ